MPGATGIYWINKFVQGFPSNIMEKPERTFWLTQPNSERGRGDASLKESP